METCQIKYSTLWIQIQMEGLLLTRQLNIELN
jgi:hypothetical protein